MLGFRGLLIPIGLILGLYWGCIAIMEDRRETIIINWSYIGIMEVEWKLLGVWGFSV